MFSTLPYSNFNVFESHLFRRQQILLIWIRLKNYCLAKSWAPFTRVLFSCIYGVKLFGMVELDFKKKRKRALVFEQNAFYNNLTGKHLLHSITSFLRFSPIKIPFPLFIGGKKVYIGWVFCPLALGCLSYGAFHPGGGGGSSMGLLSVPRTIQSQFKVPLNPLCREHL